MPNESQEVERYEAETEQIKAHARLMHAQAAEVEARNQNSASS